MQGYDALYKQLNRAIIDADGQIDTDTSAFVKRFVSELPQGKNAINAQAEQELTSYLTAMRETVRKGITTATVIGMGGKVEYQSKAVLKLAEQAFNERWADGFTLSQRLWRWNDRTRGGIELALREGVKTGKTVNSLIYDMQRMAEFDAGKRFAMITDNRNQWTQKLADAAKGMIHNPESKAHWHQVVADTEVYVEQLAKTGTRSAGEQLLKEMRRAVEVGKTELVNKSLKWWLYDKQLYNLKRIARTEMATAGHRAVIASTEQDATIIGYQWRLSSGHPVADICDYYASIDQGLGKGVWRKDSVPRTKAHPHCQCLLIPRVTPIKEQGSENYAQFLERLPVEKQHEMMPKWVQNLHGLGLPLQRVVRHDGLGLLAKEELRVQMGGDKFQATEALGKALVEKQWGISKLKRNLPMTKETLASLSANSHIGEVSQFLTKLERDAYHVDSLEWHYFRYKYHFNDTGLTSASVLNQRFDNVLQDKLAAVYRTKSGRLAVASQEQGRMAIVHVNGQRVSVYNHTNADIEPLGEPSWTIKQLII